MYIHSFICCNKHKESVHKINKRNNYLVSFFFFPFLCRRKLHRRGDYVLYDSKSYNLRLICYEILQVLSKQEFLKDK